MIALPTGTRIWIAAGVTDMRKGFTGLSAKVQTILEQNPFSGHVFVFRGRRGDLIKVLWWDGDGLCLFAKRLERGRFVWPQAESGTVVLSRAQLSMLPTATTTTAGAPTARSQQRAAMSAKANRAPESSLTNRPGGAIPRKRRPEKGPKRKRDERDAEKTRRGTWRHYTVFNVEQAEGLKLPERKGVEVPQWEAQQNVEKVIRASGVTIREVNGERAYYNMARDHIVLPERAQFKSAEAYYQTALHEVGHSTGHKSRMNRESLQHGITDGFGSQAYAREELRAEISAMMSSERLGVAYEPQHGAAYVASWEVRAARGNSRTRELSNYETDLLWRRHHGGVGRGGGSFSRAAARLSLALVGHDPAHVWVGARPACGRVAPHQHCRLLRAGACWGSGRSGAAGRSGRARHSPRLRGSGPATCPRTE